MRRDIPLPEGHGTDAALPGVNRRIVATRRQFALPLARRYSRLLSEVQELVRGSYEQMAPKRLVRQLEK